MRRLRLAAAITVLGTGAAFAQSPPANPYTSGAREQFDLIQGLIRRAAEKAGEDIYGFKPTPEVRSFGAMVGHAADGNNLLCGLAAGKIEMGAVMKNIEAVRVHEKKTAKADLIAGLDESVAYCRSVFDSLTDVSGTATVQWFSPKPLPKLLVLTQATSHAWEHYGNLVTYLRLKGIVPPSSERQQ